MSKKNKVSSGKNKAKTSAKPAKKKTAKAVKPAPKKKAAKKAPVKTKTKPVKPAKKAAKVVKKAVKAVKKPTPKATKKVIAKKTVKSVAPKKSVKAKTPIVKSTKVKTVVKGSIKEYSNPVNEIKNPALMKKEDKPITEFKPTIQPTVKKEVKAKETFSDALKSSTGSSLITNTQKTEAYSLKPEKEPAGKFEIEIVIRASAEMLYEFLVSPSGLSEWFCDDVNIRNGIYTFIWDGQMQQARLLKTIEEQLVRYQWVEKTDGSYFEFKIQKDDLTNDISLIITDFATDKGEQESAKLLWHSQIDKLLHVIGSYF